MNNLYKIGPSQIHGNGLIATQDIEPNQMIGLSHRGGQVASELGQYVNHSDNPTAISMPSGNERYIISNQFIKAGGEITQNYRLQPELEQPEDFNIGGETFTPEKDGYRTYSPFKNYPHIDIDGNTVNTDNLAYDKLRLIGDNGLEVIANNNSGIVTVPGANNIREIPIAQNGTETEYRPQSQQITADTIVDPNIPLAPTQDEQLLVDYYQPVVDWFDDYLKSDYYKTLLNKELPGGNTYSKKMKKEATKRQLAYTENYPYTDPEFDPLEKDNQYLSIYNYMEPDRDSIYYGAFYRPSKKYINMYGWQYPGSFGGGKNIMAHELGHTDDGIISGPSWDKWVKDHNKLIQSGEVEWKEDDQGDHSSRTAETRSDIIRLRYMLDEASLFNTTGEYKEFTEEDYDKAFEKFGSLEDTDSRIFKLYNKEDVIYLMNNMANIDANPFEIADDIGGHSNYISKYGGQLPKAQLGKGLTNLITRLGSPKIAKDYGFPLPSIKGFTPPFSAPLPLVQGRNTFNNETIYTKLHDQRTHPRVQDYSFEDMTGEYDWLVQARQHSNNIVQAKNPVFDSQGKLFSYDMPDLTQQGYIPFSQYLSRIEYDRTAFNKPEFGKDYILKRNEVYNVIRDLNSKGLFHLDLHTRNLMIKPDPTDLKILDWKLIDPVGLPKITQDINFSEFPPIQYTDGWKDTKTSLATSNKSQNDQYLDVMKHFNNIERNRHRGIFDYMEYSKKQWPWDLKEPFQLGGTIGRNIIFPKKVIKKIAIDGRYLPTKKLDNVLTKNFNQGEQLLILNTLKQNPQLTQNNNIDITKLQEAVNYNLFKSQPSLTDVTSITKKPLYLDETHNIVKSGWGNIETGDDLGLYRYADLLPSQFKKGNDIEKFKNIQGQTSYINPLIQLGNSTVSPLNFSYSMPGLFTDTHLPTHHDGLKLLDDNAIGWLRGFVDERFPNTYMLKEAQIDLSKDELSHTFKTPSNYKSKYSNINDLLAAENMRFSEKAARSEKYLKKKEEALQISEKKLADLKDLFNNNYGLDDNAEVLLQGNTSLTMKDVNSEIAYLEELIKHIKNDLTIGTSARFPSITDPLQASRLFNKPYYNLHNEMLPLLRDKGFTQLGIPTPSTINTIQGWTGPEQVLYNHNQKGVYGHYNNLAKNQNLQSASLGPDRKFLNNMYQLDNYVANIYNILNKPYKPFKKEGGEVYKYERSPFKDGKFVISNPEDLIIEISKTEVFTPEFKMGGTIKMNEYGLEKKFDNDRKLPYIEYTGDPDLEGRVYYDDETNEIVDVTTLELRKKRRHNRIKVIIDKYEEGNELSHTEKDVLNSLGLLD